MGVEAHVLLPRHRTCWRNKTQSWTLDFLTREPRKSQFRQLPAVSFHVLPILIFTMRRQASATYSALQHGALSIALLHTPSKTHGFKKDTV